ncbi:MAG: cytidylyltransferase domain-containing protein, partial [Ilumatobacteraceae bacterium]
MTRTVAVVQARLGSSRFPEKMLARLGEWTLLEWV